MERENPIEDGVRAKSKENQHRQECWNEMRRNCGAGEDWKQWGLLDEAVETDNVHSGTESKRKHHTGQHVVGVVVKIVTLSQINECILTSMRKNADLLLLMGRDLGRRGKHGFVFLR